MKTKLILKYEFCLLAFILLNYGCNQNSYSKSLCETTYFHDDNNQNDTNKVVFENRVAFDTTANRLVGHIIDSLTKKPIIGPKVYMRKDSKHFFDSTDKDGEFVFFKDNFSGLWQMAIYDDKGGHNCLLI